MDSTRAQQTSPKSLRPRFIFDIVNDTRDDEAVLRARLANETTEQKRLADDVALKLKAYAKKDAADRTEAEKKEILQDMAKRFTLLDDIEFLEYELQARKDSGRAPRLTLSALSCEARADNFFKGWLRETERNLREEESSSQ